MERVFCSLTWMILLVPIAATAELQLSKRQVTDLFNGNTVYYRDVPHSLNIVAYFDPSGEVRGVRGGKPYRQLWSVDHKGRHCVQDADEKRVCHRVFRRDDGTFVKYRKGGPLMHYRGFEEGNPNNL